MSDRRGILKGVPMRAKQYALPICLQLILEPASKTELGAGFTVAFSTKFECVLPVGATDKCAGKTQYVPLNSAGRAEQPSRKPFLVNWIKLR